MFPQLKVLTPFFETHWAINANLVLERQLLDESTPNSCLVEVNAVRVRCCKGHLCSCDKSMRARRVTQLVSSIIHVSVPAQEYFVKSL